MVVAREDAGLLLDGKEEILLPTEMLGLVVGLLLDGKEGTAYGSREEPVSISAAAMRAGSLDQSRPSRRRLDILADGILPLPPILIEGSSVVLVSVSAICF